MIRKVHLTFLVLFGFAFSWVAPLCFADARALFARADDYEEASKYVQAEAIYKRLATDWAGWDDGLKAQRRLACLYVKAGRMSEAETACQELLARYSGHRDAAEAADDVADAYYYLEEYDRAFALYSKIVQTWPESKQAVESQGSIASVYAKIGQEEAADAVIEKLIADFSGNDDIPKVVGAVADAYYEVQRYDKALALYNRIMRTWPESEQARQSQGSIIRVDIRLDREEAANAATEKLIADFSGNDDIAEVVDDVADAYRKVGKYDKAFALYSRIVQTWPKSEQAIRSQACIAQVNIELGREEAAEAAIEKLIADFKNHRELPRRLCFIAEEYLYRAGRAERDECCDNPGAESLKSTSTGPVTLRGTNAATIRVPMISAGPVYSLRGS
jgi:tetratricopeptide (TPR) repeat protein